MATGAAATETKVSLEDVIVTRELDRRAAPASDHAQIKRAIQDIATTMAEGADVVLPRFVDLAMELGEGVAAGISIFEPEAQPPVFRWAFLRGSLAAFEGATTPRDFSPCGITLDDDRPTLARHAERFYSWISDANIVVPEVLLVPLHRGNEQLGTLWIVSDRTDHFNAAHARAITELAQFVGVALRMTQTEARLKIALAEQEQLALEMSHRVKNVFNIVDGMISVTEKSATSKADLAEILSGRIRALGKAHGLVRRSFSNDDGMPDGASLGTLLKAILGPYETPFGQASRISLQGPEVGMGAHATNGLALVAHELATNAIKYGALKHNGGTVEIAWRIDGEALRLDWTEHGGPRVEGEPATTGFGTRLVRQTIVGSLGGTIAYDWKADGLKVEVRAPLQRLKF